MTKHAEVIARLKTALAHDEAKRKQAIEAAQHYMETAEQDRQPTKGQ